VRKVGDAVPVFDILLVAVCFPSFVGIVSLAPSNGVGCSGVSLVEPLDGGNQIDPATVVDNLCAYECFVSHRSASPCFGEILVENAHRVNNYFHFSLGASWVA